MNITPDQVDTVESGGMLDNQDVKLIRLKGGFWMGIVAGKVVTGGSHPAIVKHTISKMFPNFQPALCKSEAYGMDAVVDKHSHFLSEDLRKSGHDIYSIQNSNDIEFQVTKHNIEVASMKGSLQGDSLILEEISFPEEFKNSLAAATTEKAIACKSKKIEIK